MVDSHVWFVSSLLVFLTALYVLRFFFINAVITIIITIIIIL